MREKKNKVNDSRSTTREKKSKDSDSQSTTREELFKELSQVISKNNEKWVLNDTKKIIQKFDDHHWNYLSARFWSHEDALHLACKIGNLGVVEYLIDIGFKPTVLNDKGQTAYHKAAFYNKVDVLKFMISRVPFNSPNKLSCNWRRTVLHVSLLNERIPENKKYVFDYLADLYQKDKDFLNAQDIDGMTALHFAVRHCNLYAVKTLLKLEVDIKLSSRQGTARSVAEKKLKHPEVKKLSKDQISDLKEILTLFDNVEKESLRTSYDESKQPKTSNYSEKYEQDNNDYNNERYSPSRDYSDKEENTDFLYPQNSPEKKSPLYQSSVERIVTVSNTLEMQITSLTRHETANSNTTQRDKLITDNNQSPDLEETLESTIPMCKLKRENSQENQDKTKKGLDRHQPANLGNVEDLNKFVCARMDTKEKTLRDDVKRNYDELASSLQNIQNYLKGLKVPPEQIQTIQNELSSAKLSLNRVDTDMTNLKTQVATLDKTTKEMGVAFEKLRQITAKYVIKYNEMEDALIEKGVIKEQKSTEKGIIKEQELKRNRGSEDSNNNPNKKIRVSLTQNDDVNARPQGSFFNK